MAIANVTLNNSFDQWRGVTNQLVVAVNEFESNANLMRFTSNTSSLVLTPNASRGAMVYITPNLSDDISNNGLTIIPSMSVLNATMNLVVASITVANAAYNNANVGLVSANNYAGDMANSVNAYANTVGVSGNAYALSIVTAANTAAYANIRVSTTAANTYALSIDTTSNTAAYANIQATGAAANAYALSIDTASNTAAYGNIRVSTTAANTYALSVDTASNTAAYGNIKVSTLASNVYTDTANAAAYANIRVSTLASNVYTDVANTAAYANIQATGAAANAYALSIDTTSNTAAYGNIRVSTLASNAYTDVANTAAYANIRVSTTAANTYALSIDTTSNTAAYANIQATGAAANAYALSIDTASNTAAYGNIRVSTLASNVYTDDALSTSNTAIQGNIRVSTTAANTYALTIDTASNTAAYGNILASTIAANNYAGVMANAANLRAESAQIKADDAYNLAVTLSGDTGDIAAINQIAFNTANAAYNNANVGLVSANNYAGAMANSANAFALSTDTASNTAAYANIQVSVLAANAYALSIVTTSNTAAYGNIRVSTVASNAYTDAANAAAYANIRASTTAANTYALGIDTASNTAAYANIRVSTVASNAYTDVANTAAYGNIRVSTVASNAYTDVANTAAYGNIRVSTVASNTYTDSVLLTANSAIQGNIRVSTVASNTYTDSVLLTANSAIQGNIRVSSIAANNYAGAMANASNVRADTKVASVTGTAGRISSTGGTTPVVDLITTGVTASIYGGASQIPVIVVDTFGRLTSVANVTVQGMDYPYVNVSTAAANNYAGAMANSGNAYANVVGISGNNWAVATFVRLSSATQQSISSDIAVSGNLTVTGNTTYVNTQTMLVGDNIITLNNDIPVNVTPTEDAGIEVKRGNASNVSLIWNETVDRWRFTNDGTNFNNLITQSELDAKVASVTGTAGRISSTGGTTPVVDLIATGVTASIYGGANQIPVITVDTFGRLTSVANVTVQGMDYPYVNVSTAAANNYAGAMANSANAYALSVDSLSNTAAYGNIRISTTAANAYALSIDSLSNTAAYGNILASTVSANNYAGFMANASNVRADTKVASVTGTAGRISSTGGTTPVVDLVTAGAGPASYSAGISAITVDAYGRVTSVTGTANYLTSVTGTSGRITSSGGTTPSIDLATAGAGAASYSSGISAITVDAYGRVTSVTGSAGYAVASSSHFIGTTSIALNRASAAQSLTGITSIDGFASSVQATVTGTNATNLLLGNMADNDSFRLRIGADATDAGWVEIATADNGTEPVFVRQYTGAFATVARTATLLDGSGNTTFPGATSGSRFFTGYDSGIANSMSCSGWFRSNGTSGWYNDTYGGGINMEDTTWVRVYANKAFLSTNLIQSNTDVRAPIFYDSNDTGYYINPNGTSNVVRINSNYLYLYNGVNIALEAAGGWGAFGTVAWIRTDSNGTGTQDGPKIWYNKGGAKNWGAGIEPGSSNGWGIWEDGTNAAFGNQRFVVAVGGNVGIGTNAPSQKLHVVGSTFVSTDVRSPIYYDSDDTISRWTGDSLIMRGGNPTIYFRDTDHNSAMIHCNANLLYILRGDNDTESWAQVNSQWPFYVDLTNNNATFGGAITAAGNITAFSDINLKTNVQTINNASELLRKLRGVTFDWIESGEHSYGCIAQEVEEIIPELVHVTEPTELDDKDKPAIKSLDYSKLVSVLIEGWKDHERVIAELKEEINRLKDK